MTLPRRSLILGATLGAVAPSIVRAQSLIDVPGDPRTRMGLAAASAWATEEFREHPGCRLVFASGHKYAWNTYARLHRKQPGQPPDYAVAIETAVTDAQGRRTIHTIPIDAVGIEALVKSKQTNTSASRARQLVFA